MVSHILLSATLCLMPAFAVAQTDTGPGPGRDIAKIHQLIEQYTKAEKKTKPGEKPTGDSLDPNVKFALSELERVLGTKVRILEGSKGKGKIEIEYYSPEDLSRIYEVIIPASDVLR